MLKRGSPPAVRCAVCALVLLSALGAAGLAFAAEVPAAVLDALVVDFKQGATNDAGYGLGNVHWIGSIVQQSNSVYYEGMTCHQRSIFLNIPGTTGDVHTLSLKHQFTKGGIHAYDFLTSWDQGILVNEDALETTFLINRCGENIGPPGDLDVTCENLHTSGYYFDVDVPDDPYMSKDGSTATRIAAYEALYGNRTVRVWGNQPITAGEMIVAHDVGPGGDTGDSYAEYILSVTTTSTQLIVELGGHLAISGDPGIDPISWGMELGSSWISGGPYHFKLEGLGGALDGDGNQTEYISLGSQDNQIKGADILRKPPVCEVTPETAETCVGGSATFTDNTTGGYPPYDYCWEHEPYTGVCIDTDATLEITNARLADEGEYRLIVTDGYGMSDTCYAYLTVFEQPACSVTPASQGVCWFGDATFTDVTTGGTPPYTYCWQFPSLTGPCIDTDATLQILGATGADAGTYSLIVTDYNGCMDTCYAILDVWEAPVCNVTPPSLDLCRFGDATFTDLTTGGTPPYTYCWQFPSLTGPCIDTDATLQILGATSADAGTYSLIVTDDHGCMDTCYATLGVWDAPVCSVTPAEIFVCVHGNATFTDASSGGTPPYTYCWQFPSLTGPCIDTDATLDLTDVRLSDAGTYSLIVTDDHGCMDTCYAVLNVWDLPVCNVTPSSQGVCRFGDATFTDVTSGGTPPYTYCWQFPSLTGPCIDTDATLQILGATSTDAGTYSLVVTDYNGCMDTCYATLDVWDPPVCSVTPAEIFVCVHGNATFTDASSGGTPPYTYCWQFPSLTGACIDNDATLDLTDVRLSDAGTYSLVVTDYNGCMDTCYAVLNIWELPVCNVTPAEISVCVHSDATFTDATSGGTPPYTYCWQFPSLTGACIDTDATLALTDVSPSDAGTYSLVVTDANACMDTCYAVLNVWEAPLCNLPDDTVEVCVHNDVSICDATSGGTPPYTYCWQFPSLTGACIDTDNCLDITSATPADAGSYSVVVTDDNGCMDTCYVEVIVNPQPSCDLTCPDPPPQCYSEGNTITVQTGAEDVIVDYDWSLTSSDGSWLIESGDGTPTLTYTAGSAGVEGCFEVIVTDENSCMDTCAVCCECESGVFCTYTQGGWGSKCPDPQVDRMGSTQPGCIRDHYFADVYGSGGVWLGDPDGDDDDDFYAVGWMTADAVKEYLPAGSTPMPLSGDYVNMMTDDGNVLISQLLALHLNVDYSCAGIFDLLGLDPAGVQCYASADVPTDCAGGIAMFDAMTVGEFLAYADSVVGGLDVLRDGVTYSKVNHVASCLNEFFEGCRMRAPVGLLPDEGVPVEPIFRPGQTPELDIPKELSVQGYPNPANPSATIRFGLPINSRVTVEVFDIQGRSVATLLNEVRPAGYHEVFWNGHDARGNMAASGVYFCRVTCCEGKEILSKVVKIR